MEDQKKYSGTIAMQKMGSATIVGAVTAIVAGLLLPGFGLVIASGAGTIAGAGAGWVLDFAGFMIKKKTGYGAQIITP